jgi:ParB family chromosome partitioning protein
MAVAKRGLGKGLDSMIPEKVVEQVKENNIKDVDNVSRETLININEIEPNKEQPRKNFDEDGIQELADSIKQFGIIQPLLLKKQGDFYIIVAGERRWRAARVAGLKKVPAIIKDYTSQEVMEIALIENIQREDLNPIEEALAYQKLIKEFNLKQDEVAERVSKSRVAVTNSMRLLRLDEKVQQMLIDGMISSGHARCLLSIDDPTIQCQIALKIFDEKLSVRETEKLIKNLSNEIQSEKDKIEEIAVTKEDSFIYRDIEEKIKKIMGTKVNIKKKSNNNGRIEIEYYSTEELERIIELFETID